MQVWMTKGLGGKSLNVITLMINGSKGGNQWPDQQQREAMVPNGGGSSNWVQRWDQVLGKAYTDVKLSGQPVQCPSEEACRQVSKTIEFGAKA
ncbi:hypothetical protein L204_100164 [Cryptococcus depauperatus]|nr:hypothetical protein L204_02354 [Cryptococcus depauperatus CBS 7855]